jgi:hypothetical protein
LRIVAALLLSAVVMSSCGTILNGTTQDVLIQSSPSKMDVKFEKLGLNYATPTTVSLKRKGNYTLVFSMAGYEELKVAINRKPDATPIIADILFSGGLFLFIDWFNGSIFKLDPEAVNVNLTKLGAVDELDNIRIGIRESEGGIMVNSSVDGVKFRVEVE